jgi:phosphopantothenoylcysteine synthetase/decarboxylase
MTPVIDPRRYMPSSSGRRFLVTAGNTRERIDDVRDWGNIFTGTTGYDIARALAAAGDVDLLTSNDTHLTLHNSTASPGPVALRARGFRTHAELQDALAALTGRTTYDAIFMTAAVADYKPQGAYEVVERQANPSAPGTETWRVRDAQAGKIKSTFAEMAVLGRRTEKLVDLFRTEWKHRGLLVKFKLEVGVAPEELLRIADASRRASGADYLVANTLEMVRGDRPGAFLVGDGGHEWVPRPQLAARMVRLVTEPPPPRPA